jgi:hypothetical protein
VGQRQLRYSYSVWNAAVAGDADRSGVLFDEMLARAEASFDPQATPLALTFGMAAAHASGDLVAARARAERLIATTGEQRIYLLTALGQCGLGLVTAHEGSPADGAAAVRQGLDFLQLAGAMTVYGYYLSYLAEAQLLAGAAAEALAAVREARALCAEQLSCVHEPELLRLEAEALWRRGDAAGAREAATQALALASERGAGAWAQRAQRTLESLARPPAPAGA